MSNLDSSVLLNVLVALLLVHTIVATTCPQATAPENGVLNDCNEALADGQSCQYYCNSGYYVSGATSCSGSTLTEARCIGCEAGKAKTGVDNSSSCNLCAVGKYQAQQNQTTCDDCPVGTSLPSDDNPAPEDRDASSDCKICVKGRYQNEKGKSECKICIAGQYRASPASGTAYDSDNSNNNGLNACDDCPAGTYLTNTGDASLHDALSDCDICGTGKYSTKEGQNSVSSYTFFSPK